MFNVLAPGKLVLTLRSTPPFVAESAFVLALTILLAAPLIVRVYLFLDKPLRILTKAVSSSHSRANRSLVIHYPAPIEVVDSTSSSYLHPESVRKINSTPTLSSNGGVLNSSSRRGVRVEGKIGSRESKVRNVRSSSNPCPSFLADSPHPVIDISDLDYKAYRHKLVETTLRKQYDDFQPPADVILNSLHLNSADSVIGVRLNDQYNHSLFDFVEEYYNVAEGANQKNVEHPHPLDHFLLKGTRRPRTSEKETETISDRQLLDTESSRNHHPGNDDGKKLSCIDDNENLCVVQMSSNNVSAITMYDRDSKSGVPDLPILRKSTPISQRSGQSRKYDADKETSRHNVEKDCSRFVDPTTTKVSSWTRNDRPASAGSASKGFSLSRDVAMSERRRATETSRTNTGCSRESKKKLEDYPPTVLPSSNKRHAGGRKTERTGGRSTFISMSSSEIASIRSDSSKRQDDQVSCYSRESSISPRSRLSSRPPWLSGNQSTSFNRKYGRSIAETSVARVARPMSARASDPQKRRKLSVSSRGRSRESSTVSSHNSVLSGERAATLVTSREKEFIGTSVGRQREGKIHLATQPRRQRDDRSKEVGNIAMKDNEEGRTLKTAESPCGERMSASGTAISDNVALSFLSSPEPARTRVHRGSCSPHQAALSADAAAAAASETSATKEPELITSDGARGKPGFGNNTPRAGPEPPLVRYRQKNLAKLNRDGRRRLRSAENLSKGASLSPQIELSAEMLNSADDTDDKSAILDGEKLAELILRIDPGRNTETIQAEIAKAATTRNDVESNRVNGVVRSKIIRNYPHAKHAANTNNFPKSHGPAAASYPARRDANSETKSGLNGTKLNTRSNDDAVGKMRYDGSSSKSSSLLTPRECANVVERKETGDIARHDADEELRLPRHDSKIGLVMNSALKRYIRMLKQGLLDHGDKDGVALASLSLSDAISILSEQGTPLSPEEIRELQTVLERIERNPELLCKQSCPSMESVV